MDMLPIAVYPSVVDESLPKVKQRFSKPQLKQFARYLTGLIVCDNKTVSAINDSFVGHNDQSALNNWLTDSDWSDEKLDKARKQLIKEELNAKNVKNGALIIDDTLNHKTGKHMEGVNIHFDHAQGKTALGHQLVTSHLAAGKYSLPLDFELYQRNENQPDFKSKNELAQALIAKAVADGFCFDRVVMDVWYFNFENTSYIEGLGKDWVAGCKINRLIQTGNGYVSLSDYLQTLPKEEFKKVSVKTVEGERCFWTFAKNVTLKKHN
jgi:SRSO17 transposase